jgi:dolichol-phosphate mannosyltransferase
MQGFGMQGFGMQEFIGLGWSGLALTIGEPGTIELSIGILCTLLLSIQIPAAALLLSRILQGPTRRPPLAPRSARPDQVGTVTVVVPTLNEADRIAPCLAGLMAQDAALREVLIVDSRSTDGTGDRVLAAAATDPRIRLLTDDPLPKDWVGRPWALDYGFRHSSPQSRWVLGIDADTQPQPQLVASLAAEAEAAGYDLVSLSPQFILEGPGEWWLQPALLVTLVYRFGPAGGSNGADRVMANGQCFLCKRDWLERLDGYRSAKQSFCDDVTLARYAAAQGAKVAFWDGAKLIKVRMYVGMAELWREWGRSLDLKDASSRGQIGLDVGFLAAVQGLPLVLVLLLGGLLAAGQDGPMLCLALGLNGLLVAIRFGLLLGIAASYDFGAATLADRLFFCLSPLADPLAAYRIALSSLQTPKAWRGRAYDF